MRFFAGLMFALTLLVLPARAQDDAAVAAWQTVITGQIEAFRTGDGTTALSFAAASFKASFSDPEQFVQAIKSWGYEPIVDSRSHSFGPYRLVSPDQVVQDVKFVGDDQLLYEAYYVLGLEEGGWRVNGVQLVQTPGVGV